MCEVFFVKKMSYSADVPVIIIINVKTFYHYTYF